MKLHQYVIENPGVGLAGGSGENWMMVHGSKLIVENE